MWCEHDRAAVRRALAKIDNLAAELESWRRVPRRHVRGARLRRTPRFGIPLPITDTLDELWLALAHVEDNWRTARQLPPRPQRSPAEARSRCIS